MDKTKYLEDLREIKNIMSRTTQFISLGGLSGLSRGLMTLLGVFVANQMVFKDQEYLIHNPVEFANDSLTHLLIISAGTLILSICCAIFFQAERQE